MLFYLATYGFATLGAFAMVTLVRDAGGEATASRRWAGLGTPLAAGGGRRSPSSCSSMAGIPLTVGFIGKWAVFTVAHVRRRLAGGAGRRSPRSVIAVFFYVRVIRMMFFAETDAERATATVDSRPGASLSHGSTSIAVEAWQPVTTVRDAPPHRSSVATTATIGVCARTLVLGVARVRCSSSPDRPELIR